MNLKSLIVTTFLLFTIVGIPELKGQDPVQREIERLTGRQVTTNEILEGLRRSGLSRAEVASRLGQQGLDPTLAEQYFDVLEGREGTASAPDARFVSALEAMGLISTIPSGATPGTQVSQITAAQDRSRGVGAGDSLVVFGRDVFGSASSRFDPLRLGPVDPDYRLGPADEIRLILTGDVELAYTLDVTREGFIVIPDVGQVFVNGITLGDLENALYDRLGRVYSGVRRDSTATTFFDVSLGRLRTNQIFLIGEVESPGARQISSVASTFNALHAAGGPTSIGSFREVLVRRGGRTAASVDLYDYLLTADASDDIRLEHGDIVFVPLAGTQVRIVGEVRRSGIYELKDDEGLRDLIRFAGEFTPEADPERILIDRVLSPADRVGQTQRRVVAVNLATLAAESDVGLYAGDVVRVFGVRDMRRDRVTLNGQVLRPGDYELAPDMSVWDLITGAGGLLPDAFRPVAHVSRLDEADSTRTLMQVSLEEDAPGRPVEDIALEDQDQVTVFSTARLRVPEAVSITGLVKGPGSYPFAEGMTAEDLILAAGGFAEAADGLLVDVVRPQRGLARSDTIGVSHVLSLEGRVPWTLDETGVSGGRDAATFLLRDGDQVYVRPLPGFVRVGSVDVEGEVERPGGYGFEHRDERVSDVINRAGGLTPEAYVRGARLVREGVLVALDLETALLSPGGAEDLVLRPGDRLVVPMYDATVLVTGEVRVESRVPYERGLGYGDYLERAGGLTDRGDRGKAYIQYANGERDVSGRFLFFRNDPRVEPGSTIFVPTKPEGDQGFDVDRFLTRTLSIMGTLATVLIAADRVGN